MISAEKEAAKPPHGHASALGHNAALLRERSQQLRAHSARLRDENRVLIQDIQAISVQVKGIILNLERLGEAG